MSAKNMRVICGVTPRASPMPSPIPTPRASEETLRSSRGPSNCSTPRCSATTIGDTISKLTCVEPSRLPTQLNCVSPEDKKRLQAVLEERDRNFMAARQLLMDHALAAKEAETLAANAKGDKLTAQEAELIARKHDEMVVVIMHELNTMELGYEKILQNLQAKEMMSDLKTSLEAKCRELRAQLAQQEELPLLRDLEEVLARQQDPAAKQGCAESSQSPLHVPHSICGSSETHTPRSEHQTAIQTPQSMHQTPRSEHGLPQTKNQYLITSNELSDHGSVATSVTSSVTSTPRISEAQNEYPIQTLHDLKALRMDEDKEAVRMMKQLKASLTKKRLKMQQDLEAKNTTSEIKPNDLSCGLFFQPEMRTQDGELTELCINLDPSRVEKPQIFRQPEVSKKPVYTIEKSSEVSVVKTFYDAADHKQKLHLQQGLRDIDFELEQLTQDLNILQATSVEDSFVNAPVMPKETSVH